MDSPIVVGASTSPIYVFTVLAFAFFMLWESLMPRRELAGKLLWRWFNNFSLGALSWYASAVAGTWLVIWLSQQDLLGQMGLESPLRSSNPVIGFLVLLTVTQFISYWTHVAFHKISWLWPIHAVHHADTEIDVSTSYRHHPLEPLISLPIVAPVVVLLGTNPEGAAAYRLFAVAATVLSHSNVRIPEALEKYLRLVLLTPDFHRIHHCSERTYTNSNYGSLVPWFDYLFGTAKHRPFKDQETMELGLEYFRKPRDNRLDQILISPLRVPREA